MHYDDDSCRLSRTFGEGPDKVAFYLERFAPGDGMTAVLAGRVLDGPRHHEVFLEFGPNGKRALAGPSYGELGQFNSAMVMTGVRLDPDEAQLENRSWRDLKLAREQARVMPTDVLYHDISPDREAQIEWLQLERKDARPIRLLLGSMGKPMEAMRACTTDLVNLWGIDVEKHRTLTRSVEPANNPTKWLTPSDYPSELLKAGTEGIVQFRLSVDEEGKPTGCRIQQSTQGAEFDQVVCAALMRRANFKPALDAHGQAIASYFRSAVRFEIGG